MRMRACEQCQLTELVNAVRICSYAYGFAFVICQCAPGRARRMHVQEVVSALASRALKRHTGCTAWRAHLLFS